MLTVAKGAGDCRDHHPLGVMVTAKAIIMLQVVRKKILACLLSMLGLVVMWSSSLGVMVVAAVIIAGAVGVVLMTGAVGMIVHPSSFIAEGCRLGSSSSCNFWLK